MATQLWASRQTRLGLEAASSHRKGGAGGTAKPSSSGGLWEMVRAAPRPRSDNRRDSLLQSQVGWCRYLRWHGTALVERAPALSVVVR